MKKFTIALLIIIALGAAYTLFGQRMRSNAPSKNPVATSTQVQAEQATPAEIASYTYTETYIHPAGDFSFMYPKGFTVTKAPSDVGETLVVQNTTNKSVGVQILITPFSGNDIDITADMIHDSLPDLAISQPQPIDIGPSRKGLAFISDNPAYNGSSREVWFVFGGHLYQISTYSYLDPVLKSIFATWKFRK